jgi:hypothetical protein
MWAIVSSPLVLSVDLTNTAMLDRVWPILSNREVIGVNQHWAGSPGQLLLTEATVFPSPLSDNGYYTYPGILGQSRGWQNVVGMLGPPSYQVGPCVDEWTGGACNIHYMTLGRHPYKMTVQAAELWCNKNSSCHGFTYRTSEAAISTNIHFRDETQIFFMDSEVAGLGGPVGETRFTSRVRMERAAPLSPRTSGVQIWVKNVSSENGATTLAIMMVNLGDTLLPSYTLPFAALPEWFTKSYKPGTSVHVRDAWNHKDLSPIAIEGGDGSLVFTAVRSHDSEFLILTLP